LCRYRFAETTESSPDFDKTRAMIIQYRFKFILTAIDHNLAKIKINC